MLYEVITGRAPSRRTAPWHAPKWPAVNVESRGTADRGVGRWDSNQGDAHENITFAEMDTRIRHRNHHDICGSGHRNNFV